MTGILADANIEGHLDFLFDLLTSKAWIEFWQALDIRYARFKEIGLTADDTDDVVWHACQDHGYVLITSNRNQKGAASLEATIREWATSDSLPVLSWPTPNAFAMTENTRNGLSPRCLKSCSTLIAIEAPGGFTCHESTRPANFSPDGRFLAVATTCTRVWDLAQLNKQAKVAPTLRGGDVVALRATGYRFPTRSAATGRLGLKTAPTSSFAPRKNARWQ